MLRYRLGRGPVPDWEVVDVELRNVFATLPDVLVPEIRALAVADVLRSEQWGKEGGHLRVRLFSFHGPTFKLTF